MAFHRIGNIRNALGNRRILRNQMEESIQQMRIPAAMAAELLVQLAQINHLVQLLKAHDAQQVAVQIAKDLAPRAHHADLAPAVGGKSGHGKIDRQAALQFQIDHLMIHHIVITMIHAAPIGALAQGGHHAVFIGARRHHVQRPA